MIENILMALECLRANKMRALLTMLGIIIGISSVIGIISLGNAMTNTLNDQMQSMGANNISVSVREEGRNSNQMQQMAVLMGATNFTRRQNDTDLFKEYQIQELKERFPDDIVEISLSESEGSGQFKDVDQYANVSLMAVNPGYFTVNDLSPLYGRLLEDKDLEAMRKVCVISDRAAENMFGSENPLGQEVRYYSGDGGITAYIVVGVYEYEQSAMMPASEQDLQTTAFIPITTAKQTSSNKNYSSFVVMTAVGADINTLTDQVDSFMNRYYRNNPRFEASAFNMTGMVQSATDMLGTVSLALAIIAAISLLVGGIGVMNIMLVSVTERTHEIGVRKALGAPNSSIRMQFVTEAVVVTLVGGVFGIILGVALGYVGANLLEARAGIDIPTIMLAVGFSMIIGVFFGFYPANKAARLNPIDALRYE